jgi:hypothetical protein
MNEGMGLKIIASGPLEWHYLRTKFHENILSGSEFIGGGHTDSRTDSQPDRQTGDMMSRFDFFYSRMFILAKE